MNGVIDAREDNSRSAAVHNGEKQITTSVRRNKLDSLTRQSPTPNRIVVGSRYDLIASGQKNGIIRNATRRIPPKTDGLRRGSIFDQFAIPQIQHSYPIL